MEARAYGDRFFLNVKCAVTVKVTVEKGNEWIHVSDTKFLPGLSDGKNLEVNTDASTSTSKTSGIIKIAIDDESFVEVTVERDGRNDSEVRDIEGHSYGVARINGKYWMTENLRCLTYDTESELYGKKRQGICPNGFRLPTRSELVALVSYADGQAGVDKGGKFLKTSVGWNSSIGNGSDGSGFHAYPCGVYKKGIYDSDPGSRTSFWASTSSKSVDYPGQLKYCMGLPSIQGKDDVVVETGYYENEGMSVRCVKK